MENNKKILVPTIVAVVTLVLLVFGATYAYFTIGSTNNFGTKDLSATVEDMAGAVVLSQETDTLSLNVTRTMMSKDNKWTAYYASGSYIPASIAKISVAGDGTYKCDYKVTVTKSSSSPENDLYKSFLENTLGEDREIVFWINGHDYHFVEEDLFPITHTDTIYNINKDNPKYIASNLKITNQYFDQNYLKGKDITLTYNISDFECELSEPNGEYKEIAFTAENMNDIGYWEIWGSEGYYFSSKNVVIPETFQGKDGEWYRVTSIEGISFEAYDGVETLELPDSVLSIGEYGFFQLMSLKNVKLPKQLKSIGEYAFYDSGLENIYLPKSLENVDYLAFGWSPLENIYYEGTEEEWNELFPEDKREYGDGYIMSVHEYLLGVDYVEEGYTLPTIHFNVNY